MKQLTRIDELAKQAWGFAYNTKHDYKTEHDAYTNKLAELIVRECMTICKEHPSRILSNNWNADAVAPDIVHRFEEHFGVEE